MPARYAPIGRMQQTATGQYVTYAELEETVRLLIEHINLLLDRVESGEMTATDAEKQLLTYRTLILGEIPSG